jgi:hypothetical protein
MDDREQASSPRTGDRGQGATQRLLAGGLAEWAWKMAIRLAMLKTPGVYDVQIIVWSDGRRTLVIQNAERPHKLEELGM